jgi:hypothetical protein
LVSCAHATHGLGRPSLDARKKDNLVTLARRRSGRMIELNAWLMRQVDCSVRNSRLSPLYFFKNPRTRAYGFFAHRNPVPIPRADGKWDSRSAERKSFGPLPQEPPRITLDWLFSGPVGFFDGLEA